MLDQQNDEAPELMEHPADEGAVQSAWRDKLLQLHHEEKLMKPLLGAVHSILYIYRRRRDNEDEIRESITM